MQTFNDSNLTKQNPQFDGELTEKISELIDTRLQLMDEKDRKKNKKILCNQTVI